MAGWPPLPVLQETHHVLTFLIDSLDDFTEDFAKVAVLWAAAWLVRRAGAGRLGTLAAVLALHPLVNGYADRFGDHMQVWLND